MVQINKDHVAMILHKVPGIALPDSDLSGGCRLYNERFLLFPKEVYQFWHLEERILYRALTFDWAIVLWRICIECYTLLHQSDFTPVVREANLKLSTRNCLLKTLVHNYPNWFWMNVECTSLYLAWSSLSCPIGNYMSIRKAILWSLNISQISLSSSLLQVPRVLAYTRFA